MNNPDFSIYVTPENYLVSWKDNIYVFTMEQPLNPNLEFAAMLAYMFTGDPETKPKKITEHLNILVPMPDEEGIIRSMLDVSKTWFHMTSEQIQETNAKAKDILVSKPLH